ncbi:sensor histidine kinase [Streptomyces sp. NPDC002306]
MNSSITAGLETCRSVARDLYRDLLSREALAPLTEPVRVRGLRRFLLVSCLAGLVLLSGVLAGGHGLGAEGMALGAAHAGCVLLTLQRPLAGWWGSLLITVATAAAIDPRLGASFPWTESGVVLQIWVLVLVTRQVRPRVAAEAWALTVLCGGLLALLLGDGGHPRKNDVLVVAALSGTAMVLVAALRGRDDARRLLAEQESATAEERSQRILLEERARIARELHDVVAHHMSVIAIQAEAAPYRVSAPPEELTRSFGTIRENALEALTELRAVLGVLRLPTMDGAGRDDAPQPTLSRLDELVDNVRSAGLTVETSVIGTPRPLPPGVDLAAYRIVQEALSNALRHAPGCEVRVEVGYVLESVTVSVRNGPARQPMQPPSGSGHGLLGMRERATVLGGELTATLLPDGGYEVTASLPATRHPEQ